MTYRQFATLLALVSCCSVSAYAQLPNPALDFVFPAGGQVGTSVTVSVSGRDLDAASRLIFSHPGLSGVPVTRPTAEFETGQQTVPNQFRIDIPANLPVGAYDVRVVGRFGASTPRTFLVADVSEIQESGDNHQPAQAVPLQIDQIANGRTDAGVIDYYRFHAEKGQSLTIECLSQQIDSSLRPVVTVWNAAHKQLRRNRLLVDPVVDFTAPESGDYLLGINDHVYAGGATHAYRLRIHGGPYLVAVAPSAARAGQNQQFTVYGRNLPGGEPTTDLTFGGDPVQKQSLVLFVPRPAAGIPLNSAVEPVTAATAGFLLQWPGVARQSNGVFVSFATQPVITEQEPNDRPDAAQTVSVPCEVNGRFFPRRDQDWVQFSATQGQTFQVRTISHRLGHPTDPEVFVQRVVKNADGSLTVAQVSTDDDFRTSRDRYRLPLRRGLNLRHRDAVVRFTADQTADYRVGLRDLNGSSIDDPRFTYRLLIEPQTPDFELLVGSQQQAADDDKKIDRGALVVRRGEALPILIDVLRNGGFSGPVQLTAVDLPRGVTAAPCIVPEGEIEGVLVLTADATTDEPSVGPIRIIGTATVNGQPVERDAVEATLMSATGNIEQTVPTARLARQLILSVVPQDLAPAQLQFVAAADAATPPVWATSLGAKLSVPVHLQPQGELKSELPVVVHGVPDKVKAQGPTLKADALDGQVELTLDAADIKPGTYTVFLRGPLKTAYSRNPEAIALAQQRRTEFDSVLQQLATEVQTAAETLAQAQLGVTQRAERLAQMETQQQAIDQLLAVASEQVTKAAELLPSLQPSDATLLAAVTDPLTAELKAITDTTATLTQQLTAARTRLGTIRDQLASVRNELQQRQAEVAAAEAIHKERTERQARAQEFVKQLDQQLADAQKNFAPADVNLFVYSSAVQLRIDPTPLGVTVPAGPVALKRGATVELTLPIERRYGFADAITITPELPSGVSDLQIAAVTLAADQASATIQAVAGPQATVGQHAIPLRLNLKFNGVDLVEKHSVLLEVHE